VPPDNGDQGCKHGGVVRKANHSQKIGKGVRRQDEIGKGRHHHALAPKGVAGSLAQYQTEMASRAKGMDAATLAIFGKKPCFTCSSLTFKVWGTRALEGSMGPFASKPSVLTLGEALDLALIGLKAQVNGTSL